MIIHADILEWAKSYDGPLFHALLCDPPYHLTETTRRFGGQNSAPAQFGTDGAFQRASRGFMGKTWDGGDIAYRPETWATLMRLLHPGAFLMAFAGSRGYHRMACAIEDAGFIIQPAIGWAFGSGFPKSTQIASQVDENAFQDWLDQHPDQRQILDQCRDQLRECRQHHTEHTTAASRTLLTAAQKTYRAKHDAIKADAGFLRTAGQRKHAPKFAAAEFGYREKDNGYNSKERESYDVTAPATDLAVAWQGHRYGGQALKPAFEFICVAQKPYAGRPVDSITRTGAGALNIDGARIGTDATASHQGSSGSGIYGFNRGDQVSAHDYKETVGRWPSNLILAHDPRCEPVGARRVKGGSRADRDPGQFDKTPGWGHIGTVQSPGYADADGYEQIADWRCHPNCAVLALGRQSGELTSGAHTRHNRSNEAPGNAHIDYGKFDDVITRGHDDTGTAARFFYQADFMLERLEAADAVVYEAKASRSEREAGLDPRQVKLLGMLESNPQTRGESADWGRRIGGSGEVDRRNFDLDTINDGRAKSIDNPYQRGETTRRNIHPCLKPLSLCRHLATLLLPPDLYAPRRLLIPFSGAGSEMIGAMLVGWEDVIGVELEADHVKIAEARLAYWSQRRHEFGDPSKPIAAVLSDAPDGQLDLFEDMP